MHATLSEKEYGNNLFLNPIFSCRRSEDTPYVLFYERMDGTLVYKEIYIYVYKLLPVYGGEECEEEMVPCVGVRDMVSRDNNKYRAELTNKGTNTPGTDRSTHLFSQCHYLLFTNVVCASSQVDNLFVSLFIPELMKKVSNCLQSFKMSSSLELLLKKYLSQKNVVKTIKN